MVNVSISMFSERYFILKLVLTVERYSVNQDLNEENLINGGPNMSWGEGIGKNPENNKRRGDVYSTLKSIPI